MSQHDYVIDNGTGSAVRADINSALTAIAGANSGATEPSTTYSYQLWADTTTAKLKIRNGADNAWIEVGALASANLGLLLASRFPNVNANVTATDEELNLMDGCTATTTELNLLDGKTSASFLTMKEVYPVGSIFTSVVSTNPATLLAGMSGTNWTAIGAGKTLIGLDSGDSDFNTVQGTGGSKTHQLSIDEMPIHTHTIKYSDQTDVEVHGSSETTIQEVDEGGSTRTTSEAGGTDAHTIVQPYFVVYFWRRDAD